MATYVALVAPYKVLHPVSWGRHGPGPDRLYVGLGPTQSQITTTLPMASKHGQGRRGRLHLYGLAFT